MRFLALDLSLDMISSLRPLLSSLRRHDSNLADQVQRAATSVALNLGEGQRRHGKDQGRFFRIASGSAEEVRVALRVAEAFGFVEPERFADTVDKIDHIVAILHKISKR